MIRPSVISAFAFYEIKRALARRKVLILVAFVLLLDTLPYYALATAGSDIIPTIVDPYVWIAGILIPVPLFIPFIAIFIAAGAMSEEYEQGTAELLLSKPVSKMEYVTGKYLGGYLLLLTILALSTLVSLTSATITFGTQLSLDILPGAYWIIAYASLLFYSIAFMLGELLRRSSIAYILSSTVLFTSNILSFYFSLIYNRTGNILYHNVQLYLPTSATESLPIQYITDSLASSGGIINFLPIGNPVEPSLTFSAVLIFLYAFVAVLTFLFYFNYADVSRRVG